jgi:hypothetical protein
MIVSLINAIAELIRTWFALALSVVVTLNAFGQSFGAFQTPMATDLVALLPPATFLLLVAAWVGWLYCRFRKDTSSHGRNFRRPYAMACCMLAAGMLAVLTRASMLAWG